MYHNEGGLNLVWRKRQDLPSLFYCRILWLTAMVEPPEAEKL